MALLELLRKPELEKDVDFLREGVRMMAQQRTVLLIWGGLPAHRSRHLMN